MRTWFLAVAVALALLPPPAGAQSATDLQAEIQEIRQQLSGMDELKSKLADLEKKLDESQKTQKASTPSVTAASKDSKLKIDGRLFTGIFSSGHQGAYPN